MKNRFIVTISDVHGSKQYSVHEIIKKIIFVAALILLLITLGTFIYVKVLHANLDTLKRDTLGYQNQIVTFKETSETFKKENAQLTALKEQLVKLIEINGDKLESMNEQLREIEEIIGIGPDINASFDERVELARIHDEEEKERIAAKINTKISEVKKTLQSSAKEEKITAIQKALLLNSIPNGEPLPYKHVSSNFGYRMHPVTQRHSFHAGIDLSAKDGTPVYAPASGVVMFAKEKGAYGNFLLITHSYGFQTAYGHLSRYAVSSGDYVTKGQLIAYVGSTGRSTGAHLHYEIRYLTKWVDPRPFIFWNLDNINNIADKIKTVNWASIITQTEKLISLSTK